MSLLRVRLKWNVSTTCRSTLFSSLLSVTTLLSTCACVGAECAASTAARWWIVSAPATAVPAANHRDNRVTTCSGEVGTRYDSSRSATQRPIDSGSR